MITENNHFNSHDFNPLHSKTQNDPKILKIIGDISCNTYDDILDNYTLTHLASELSGFTCTSS